MTRLIPALLLLLLSACSVAPNDDTFDVRRAVEPGRTYVFGWTVR